MSWSNSSFSLPSLFDIFLAEELSLEFLSSRSGTGQMRVYHVPIHIPTSSRVEVSITFYL